MEYSQTIKLIINRSFSNFQSKMTNKYQRVFFSLSYVIVHYHNVFRFMTVGRTNITLPFALCNCNRHFHYLLWFYQQINR